MAIRPTTKIVYLDQKCWIDIAKMYYPQPSGEYREFLEKIFESSEKGQMIFPLSISHFEETMRIASSNRRSQLAFLMAKLSRGYSLQPYVDVVIEAEIENMILRKAGFPARDMRKFVLKKGIPHLIGAKPELKFHDSIDIALVKKLEKKLLDELENPKTFETILKLNLPKEFDEGIEKAITTMEEIRRDLRKITDNNRRWRAFLAINIGDTILPKLAKMLIQCNLPKDFVTKEKMALKDVYEFLDNIPTALCYFTLIFRRDQQFQRPIPKNDFADIWFLTLAIPYCDIVITEKMWTAISRQAKLDEKCNTIILSSIKDLGKYV